MKLPIPKIGLKLPALPFRKKNGRAGGEQDAPGARGNGRPRNRLSRTIRLAGLSVLGVSVIGGLGAVIGWLAVNGPETVAQREARRPVLTVAILADGETPKPNSSLDNKPAPEAGHEDGAENQQDVAEGEHAGDGHGTGHDMADGGQHGVQGLGPDPTPLDQEGPTYEVALTEETEKGLLPVIAPDGRQSWQTYARAFDGDTTTPRIAIILTRMGISKQLTRAAIEVLPPDISFSFSPDAPDINQQVAAAQRAGHEVFLDIPLEPFGYPANDPGPTTLLTSLNAVDNLNRLESMLGMTAGYAGVVGIKGSQFTTDEEALTPVLGVLKDRGLMYVDSAATSRTIALELASSIQLPRAVANWRIDDSPDLEEISQRLSALERTARRSGAALGLVPPLPLTIDALRAWTRALPARGYVLAPATAIANKQSLR